MGAPQIREIRRAYGFDDVSLVPGEVTINPDQTSTEFSIDGTTISIPILAAAMDAIVSPAFAVEFHGLGGLAVMNLEGVQTKYDDPEEVLARLVEAPEEDATTILQEVYAAPVRDDLIGARVQEIKSSGARCAVSVTPANTKRLAPIAEEAGADMIVVQSTVTTARHISKSARSLVFSEFLETVNVPVLVGNCVSYNVALELMETGIHGVLVGVGPGAACTTREVTGVACPRLPPPWDCAAARDVHLERTGK